MNDSLFLRLKSLNTRTVRGVTSPKNIVRVAAMHNLREIAAELGATAASGINPGRMHLNYILRGQETAAGVADLALALLKNAGVESLRRDACMALELVVSVPADSAVDYREYFAAAVAWADAYFNVPILSAAVHLDEAAPHCHILLLPLVAGRMQGGALAGGPARIRAMLADFQLQVAQRFGLTHQARAKRPSKLNRDLAGRMVLNALRARPERLQEPAMRDALIAGLGSQAGELLALLGLSLPNAKAKPKSFADIMTAPCKPERIRRTVLETKCIDVAQNSGSQEGGKFDNVYLCVDVASSISPNPAHEQPRQPAQGMQASPPTGQANATQYVELVDHRTGACHPVAKDALTFERISPAVDAACRSPEYFAQQQAAGTPSDVPRTKLSTTELRIARKCVPTIFVATSALCANGMRPHKDASRSGSMCQGGGVSPPPASVPNFGQTHAEGIPNSGDTPTASSNLLKSQQVDQQAGHVGAHRRSFKGGAGIAPPTRSPDHCATGPPASASP